MPQNVKGYLLYYQDSVTNPGGERSALRVVCRVAAQCTYTWERRPVPGFGLRPSGDGTAQNNCSKVSGLMER